MTHTPGPWHIEDCVYPRDFTIWGPGRAWVGYVTSQPFVKHAPERDEAKSNAQLIAAAPDLIEAAELALEELDRIVGGEVVEVGRLEKRQAAVRALERAVRKARGES